MAKNLGKWIGNNEINGSKIQLTNGQFVRGRNALNTADINMLKVNTADQVEFGAEPVSAIAPTTPNSLTNRQYVLDVLAGVRDLKDAVRLATLTLPAYTPSGAGIGKILTADVNEALLVDSIAVSIGDRVAFLANSVDAGIYTVTQVGDAVNPFILTRSLDADEDIEVTQGLSFDVVEGVTNGKTRWLLTTSSIVVDTTVLTFVETPNPASLVHFVTESFTLAALDITNGYVDLANLAESGSVIVLPVGGPIQEEVTDYVLSNVGGITRVTFAGDLALNLVDTDKLIVKYARF